VKFEAKQENPHYAVSFREQAALEILITLIGIHGQQFSQDPRAVQKTVAAAGIMSNMLTDALEEAK
jgi:hypothetical protein